MSDFLPEKLTILAFEKAAAETNSHVRNRKITHIKNYLQQHKNIHQDTSGSLKRMYKKYIEKEKNVPETTEQSLSYLAQYLGYENYLDFVYKQNNPTEKTTPEPKESDGFVEVLSLIHI